MSGVKPALKNKEGAEPVSVGGNKQSLNWDEEVIAEHDKLRGTRMKIEEPNTPYHYDTGTPDHHATEQAAGEGAAGGGGGSPGGKSGGGVVGLSLGGGLSLDHLSNKLNSVAAVQETHGHPDDEDEDEEAAKQKAAERKKAMFAEHRKRHYNEMEMVRRFRAQQQEEDEDEDEE